MEKHTKYIRMGAIGLICAIGFYYVLVPSILYYSMKSQRVIKPGGLLTGIWKKLPISIESNVYLWNVTNPDAVTKGAKPNLVEVGPWIYDEWRWKANVKHRESDDTVVYQPETWWYYNQEKSGRLTGDETVTIPNILLLAVVAMVKAEMPGILGMVNQALNELFRNPKSIYMTVRVRDLMFDGITINCTVKELSTRSICSLLGVMKLAQIKKVVKNVYSFSMLGGNNGTWGDRYRAKRGIKNFMEVGDMVEYKDKTRLTKWLGASCNEIVGTDGTMIPPYLTKTSVVRAFVPDICRALGFKYVQDVVVSGIPAMEFTGDMGDIRNTPEDHCYCNTAEVPKSCPLKGTMDLTRCAGVPLIISMPHFLKADNSFLGQVNGMNPDPVKHGIFFNLIPDFGAPVSASIKLQFNIEIKKTPQMDIMKSLPTAMHPILWLNENIVLPDIIITAIWVVSVLGRWFLFILSMACIFGFGALLIYGIILKRRQNGGEKSVSAELMANRGNRRRKSDTRPIRVDEVVPIVDEWGSQGKLSMSSGPGSAEVTDRWGRREPMQQNRRGGGGNSPESEYDGSDRGSSGTRDAYPGGGGAYPGGSGRYPGAGRGYPGADRANPGGGGLYPGAGQGYGRGRQVLRPIQMDQRGRQRMSDGDMSPPVMGGGGDGRGGQGRGRGGGGGGGIRLPPRSEGERDAGMAGRQGSREELILSVAANRVRQMRPALTPITLYQQYNE